MYIPREQLLSKLIAYRDKDIVKIITGIRRCGKSVLLNELYYDYLLKDGLPEDHIVKIALDLKKWVHLRDGNNLYQYIGEQIADEGKYYIFLDEIQMVDGFEEVVNSIKAEHNTDVYITGSNSKLLSSDINTIFRGRGIEIKVFPLSFSEFVAYKDGADKLDAFDEYIKFGGLPYAAIESSPSEKTAYLNMLSDTVVKRDMIDRYGIRNEPLFNALLEFLCSAIGSYISTSKISNTLKSNGFKTADNETISRYLSYMCDAFLFYKVQRYDIKGKGYLKTQNKYYAADMGLRNAITNYRQLEVTHIIENLVYIELIRRSYTVDIGKNRDKEIDFIARAHDGRRFYIQVSYTIEEAHTKERELSAFRGLDDGYKKILITMDRNPLTNLENGYQMMHLFDFLLNANALESA